MKSFYVTMTDSFLSGWGMADGRIAKYVYECDSYEEAEIVAKNATKMLQKYVNIVSKKPYYSMATHYTQYKTKASDSIWYREA